MLKLLLLLLCPTLLAAQTPPVAPEASSRVVPATRQADLAWILPIHGPIDAITLKSIERRLNEAQQAGADTVVIELDTPGGELESTIRILQALRAHDSMQSVAWVRPLAFSAGVIIALGTDAIVTTPTARLGDAAPITPLGPLPAAERAKIESPLLAEVTDSARRHGHDERLAQAFVSVGMELWLVRDKATGDAYIVDAAEYREVFGEAPPSELTDVSTGLEPQGVTPRGGVIPWLGGAMGQDVADIDSEPTLPPGRDRLTQANAEALVLVGQIVDRSRLLTLTAPQARAWGLSNADIPNEASLATYLGGATLHRSDETWSEDLARVLMSWPVRIVLIVLIVIGFVIEMAAPGTGAFALGSMLALLLLIGAPWLAGLSNWWPLLAVLVGLAFIAMEVTLAPGTLFLGLLGTLLLLGGLVFAVSTPMSGADVQGTHLVQGLMLVGAGIVISGAVLWAVVGPLGFGHATTQRLALLTPKTPPTATHDRTGCMGKAVTELRPAGRIELDGHIVDAICSGRWIEAGTPVRVVHDGMELEVEPQSVNPEHA